MFILILNQFFLTAQISLKEEPNSVNSFFVASDSANKTRIYSMLGFSTALYSSSMIGLYNSWYANYEQRSFHLFNDWKEWNQMDKVGHVFSAYFEADWTYQMARWAGVEKKNALWSSFVASTLVQLSIEVMDGFSAKWGFSVPDVASNLLGTNLFLTQEYFFDEQIVKLKFSSWPKTYPNYLIKAENSSKSVSLQQRADQLYGAGFAERLLKDYNQQHYWLSMNIESLTPGNQKWIPDWLDFSIGYSGENLFGGFDNSWIDGQSVFQINHKEYPRYRQYYCSFDIDFKRVKVKNPLLKSIFNVIQIVKVPFPAIEYNVLDSWKWNWLVF